MSSSFRADGKLRRLADIVVAAIVVVVSFPVLFVVAIAVGVTSRGPVLFTQRRVGRGGVEFSILKFRTMVHGAEKAGPSVSGMSDPRVTKVGRPLRRTKLDEFPQLWNVLRGEMTIVGPRPEVPEMIVHYTPEERVILDHLPGIIGPGQLFFATEQAHLLDEADDAEVFYIEHVLHPKLAVDLEYLEQRHWRRDLVIAGRTLRYAFASIFRRGKG